MTSTHPITRLVAIGLLSSIGLSTDAQVQLKFNMDDIPGDADYFVGDNPTNYNLINWDTDLEDNDPLLAGVNGQEVANAIDVNTGLATGISLSITSATGWNEAGPNRDGTLFPGPAVTAVFDEEAIEVNLFGHSSNFNVGGPRDLIEYTIAGLDSSKYYDFTFFASRIGATSNRETQYDVIGTNSSVALLNPSDNDDNIAQALQVQPTGAGELVFQISAGPNNDDGNGFIYLGAFDITENGNAPPLGSPGDFDGSGFVDAADYTLWRDNEGAGTEVSINNNGDGLNGVDSADYDLWVANFGNSSSSASAIPEPGCLVLMAIGMLAVAGRRS